MGEFVITLFYFYFFYCCHAGFVNAQFALKKCSVCDFKCTVRVIWSGLIPLSRSARVLSFSRGGGRRCDDFIIWRVGCWWMAAQPCVNDDYSGLGAGGRESNLTHCSLPHSCHPPHTHPPHPLPPVMLMIVCELNYWCGGLHVKSEQSWLVAKGSGEYYVCVC